MGGSYNPVHAGHMIVASYIAQWGALDEVWLTLSPQNPFKRNLNLADDAHRLEMLRIAVGSSPFLRVCDVELSMPRPSYTVDTLARLSEMYPDCDMDTLLIKACPVGPTCHRGTTACFDTPAEDGFIRSLSSLIARRHEEMPEDSYTTRLFIKGVKKIAQKVGEEAVESAIEAVDGNRDRFIYEAADLMYHYLVLLEQMGVTLPDIERELVKRHS